MLIGALLGLCAARIGAFRYLDFTADDDAAPLDELDIFTNQEDVGLGPEDVRSDAHRCCMMAVPFTQSLEGGAGVTSLFRPFLLHFPPFFFI